MLVHTFTLEAIPFPPVVMVLQPLIVEDRVGRSKWASVGAGTAFTTGIETTASRQLMDTVSRVQVRISGKGHGTGAGGGEFIVGLPCKEDRRQMDRWID